jgi:hypothetical protein
MQGRRLAAMDGEHRSLSLDAHQAQATLIDVIADTLQVGSASVVEDGALRVASDRAHQPRRGCGTTVVRHCGG